MIWATWFQKPFFENTIRKQGVLENSKLGLFWKCFRNQFSKTVFENNFQIWFFDIFQNKILFCNLECSQLIFYISKCFKKKLLLYDEINIVVLELYQNTICSSYLYTIGKQIPLKSLPNQESYSPTTYHPIISSINSTKERKGKK